MNRLGVTLLEIVAATVLLAMVSGAALVALRLQARIPAGIRRGYVQVSTLTPPRLGTSTSTPRTYSLTDLGTGQGLTAEQQIRWYRAEPDGEPQHACLRFAPLLGTQP